MINQNLFQDTLSTATLGNVLQEITLYFHPVDFANVHRIT